MIKNMNGREPWNKGVATPGNKCAEGCTCNRHRPKSPELRAKHRETMLGKNVGKKYGPPTEEHREKNRQAQIGNQHALGAKHTLEARQRRSELNRQMWLDGNYDNKHPCWGRAGKHAGIKVRCLNSEGVFARDLDEAGIAWEYEPKRFKLSWCTYLPDFYLPEFDIWVEVKGYMSEEAARKVETFRRETGKTLVVVYQPELSSLDYSKLEKVSDQGVDQN
jgi:hypothetical protein